MPEKNIVITGAGVVSPIGMGHSEFFDALLTGKSAIRSLADRDDGGHTPPISPAPAGDCEDGLWIGAPVIGFDGKQYVKPRKALKVMCREIQFAFASAMMAVDDAGLSSVLPATNDGMIGPNQIGTVFGSEMLFGPPAELAEAFQCCLNKDGKIDESQFGGAAMRKVMPLWMLKYLPNMPACHVGIAINAQGPNNSIIHGDSSGPAAMIEAISCIQRGVAAWIVTGGVGTRINTTRINYRNDLPIASVADPISKSSRPHDPASTGVVGGEAAVAFVIEGKQTAEKRGAVPLAEIVATASRFVASKGMLLEKRSSKIGVPGIRGSAKAISLAIEACLRDAKITATEIGFVVSHAMGDPVIDEQEQIALTAMLPEVPVVAPINAVGHCGAASGSLELLVAALALSRNVIPPSMNLSDPIEHRSAQPLQKDYAICVNHTSEGNAIATLMRKA
ncbi:3-oxoacyl-[acyl-carrier-protein] synthase 2 [Planctomycetes bacterium CA13]|uniref:3-oxoacyl-[acyl-carrier-protein] synthase 2 n=1 Tax=Novipirellula herctigrandis TaxID=2527986 RepID=A0A5C5YN56_9BACT|nr:3-oxoacyl-[acyl-carrier-protein] synthase 2 [Planctomycetes bacterium CA13]